MGLYDILVDFKGRKAILHSDPDRFIFVNDNAFTWESGEPFTTEEIVEYIRYYARHKNDPEPGVAMPGDIIFVDGQEKYYGGYGLAIDIDENGDPLYKIVEGKILSARDFCSCEEKGATHFRVYSKEDYDSHCESLVSSGVFTLLDERYMIHGSKYLQYKCNKCGDIWMLQPYDSRWIPGQAVSMINRKNFEKGLKRRGEDKGTKARHIFILIAALAALILFFVGLALLVT